MGHIVSYLQTIETIVHSLCNIALEYMKIYTCCIFVTRFVKTQQNYVFCILRNINFK